MCYCCTAWVATNKTQSCWKIWHVQETRVCHNLTFTGPRCSPGILPVQHF